MTNSDTTSPTWNRLAVSGGRAFLRAEAPGGSWKINPPMGAEPVRLSYNLADGRDYSEILAAKNAENPEHGTEAYWRYASLLGTDFEHHGYADTQEDAVALIETLLNGSEDGDVSAMLTEAGFRFKHRVETRWAGPLDFFIKRMGHSYFTIIRSDTHIHLTFEKDGWGYCENLATFTLRFKADAGYDHTVFWPERVMQNFPVLTLRACLQMVDRYIADGRNKRRKRS